MPRRPWKSYRPVSGKPYIPKWKKTGKGRRYTIKHIPESKIRMFTIGKEGDYDYILTLISLEAAQVSHLSLEAARIACNRYLREKLGRDNYLMRILPYPHHVVREHKMMAFAGADRIQDGMRRAFGKPFGRAARVKKNQKMIIIKVRKNDLEDAKSGIKRARMKFPMPCRVSIEKIERKTENSETD
ncbi:MAG: 50S ribosomal protein L16 [Candidatus Helarchaeota archaeon]|nr:50S ribosomal protein L16 [Candidatus Helarchaeota archaeon]